MLMDTTHFNQQQEPEMPRKPAQKNDPDSASKNLQYMGEQLLDITIGKVTVALLKAGKPVTPETLAEALHGQNEMAKDFYIPAHEFLASLQKPS
ncbi:hypothetical protein [uncultured Desulfovibrio sp.]|nr:hypothetical protein [uncultured Desulfovibrio sp.]